MNKFLKGALFAGLVAGAQCVALAATPEEHVVYGVRVYDDTHESAQALVSFPLNDLSKLTVVQDFSDLNILTAACDGTNYYFMTTEDGMVPYSFYSYNLTTKSLTKVADYEVFVDAEASLLPLDMTYDAATGNLYLMSYDLSGWTEESDDEPFGLYKLDKTTGKTTLIGYEEQALIVALAADPDGMLWGISEDGELYEISKRSGRLGEIYCYSEETPLAKQSATFDSETGKLYWGGFYNDSFFGAFTFGEEEVTYERLGELDDRTELIGLYIDTDPVSGDAPAAVTDLEFYPAANGVNEAVIFWMNPTTTVGGSALEGQMSVEIARDGVVVGTVSDLVAGKDGYYLDKNVPNGLHTYQFTSSNEYGVGGVVVGEPIYVGVDVPAAVENLKAVKGDNNSISVSWTAPTTSAHNGYCDLSALTYNVTRLPDNKVVANGISETSVVDNEISDAKGYRYVVAAYSNGNKGVESTSNKVISGDALSVPYSCDFSNEEANDLWTVIDADQDNYTWYAAQYGNGTTYMRYYPTETLDPNAVANDWAISAPIALEKGKHYLFSYELWGMGDLFPVDYAIAMGSDASEAGMTTVLESKDWEYLPQALGNVKQHSVTVDESGVYYFGINVKNLTFLNFTNVKVEELLENDGTVTSYTGPSSANVGSEATFTVGVKNNGYSEINGFDIYLMDPSINGPLVTEHFDIKLASLESTEVTLTWTPSVVANYSIYPVLLVEGDSNELDNTADAISVSVMPYGTWHDVTEGNSYGMLSPFGITRTNSASQTIYLKDEINANDGEISCLKYYYYIAPGYSMEPLDMNVKLYMANTTATANGSAPVAVEDMELVYDGTATINPSVSDITFILDKNFNYTGEGLIVHSEHSASATTYALNWMVLYEENAADRTFIYYGDKPYDGGEMTSWVDVPNVSFLFEKESGVESVKDVIPGEFKVARLYTVSGQVVAEFNDADSMNLGSLQSGIYILQIVDSSNNTTVKKFAVK